MTHFTKKQLESAFAEGDKLWEERPSNSTWSYYDCVTSAFSWELSDEEHTEITNYGELRAEYPNTHNGHRYKMVVADGEFYAEATNSVTIAEFECMEDLQVFDLTKATYIDGDFMLPIRSIL